MVAFKEKGFDLIVAPDERAAGFIALGFGLEQGKSALLVSTSGTAAVNYFPAVAEAYFQGVPLLICTADRPPEWIGQEDGQTIYQDQVFGKHVKAFFSVDMQQQHSNSQWNLQRLGNEIVLNSRRGKPGPVHINFPFREPFYANQENLEALRKPNDISLVKANRGLGQLSLQELEDLYFELCPSFVSVGKGVALLKPIEKILIVAGQMERNLDLEENLKVFQDHFHCAIIAEPTSNLKGEASIVRFHDFILSDEDQDKLRNLQPHLVISIGGAILSKKLKLWLRQNPPLAHWKFQQSGEIIDTFQSLTRMLTISPNVFFERVREDGLYNYMYQNLKGEQYQHQWEHANHLAEVYVQEKKSIELTEWSLFQSLDSALPEDIVIHLANSMPVRYAALTGIGRRDGQIVRSNRGACGIDGCVSTAVGAALATPDKQHVLLCGDMSFFYDANAHWLSKRPNNLKILVSNNQGGGIFRLIHGPSTLPGYEPYFEAPHNRNAKRIAEEFGYEYYAVHQQENLEKTLQKWLTFSGMAVIEIFTTPSQNEMVYKQLFKDFSLQPED